VQFDAANSERAFYPQRKTTAEDSDPPITATPATLAIF